MKNLKGKKRLHTGRTIMISILMFCGILIILIVGTQQFKRLEREQNLVLTENALKKSIIQCYAIEGFYPAEISYLEDNYNLMIDDKKYNIYYESFSSNIMPEFKVYEK